MATKTEPEVVTVDKSLQSKAIDIKGKKYVLVADRIIFFNENFPHGEITTELISPPESTRMIVKAIVCPDVTQGEHARYFTGHGQETIGEGYINATSALENAETSAVGRALAMMGIGVIDSVASVDEMNKAAGAKATGAKAKTGSVEDLIVQGIKEAKEQGVIDDFNKRTQESKKFTAEFKAKVDALAQERTAELLEKNNNA